MKMALYINQAYALKQHLIMAYFGQGQFVEPPPFVEIVAIREVEIIYHWIGLASSNIDYQITITNANTNPQAQGVINGETIFSSLDKERVQALGPALTDLFPIGSALKNLAPCTDNYPNWVVIVNFEDGTTLEMVTNDSNLVGVGGPWQTKIEGRLYFQASASFFITLADILEQLKLEIDDRTTWGCTTILPIFDLAYPSGTE
jgi:hypothetical protein